MRPIQTLTYRKLAWSWARDLVVSVALAVVVILFIYQPVEVEGTSMLPSLADQERIFIDKLTLRLGLGEIKRGDLVIFRLPGEPDRSYIKRVVGLPGERIKIVEGYVYVNGEKLEEDYVISEYRNRESTPEVTVGANQYFVLGDHRSSSSDSRTWGPIGRELIYGKAVFVYWPLERIGPVR